MTPAEVAGYRVVRALGAGGMGEVLEVEEPATGRRLALKRIRGAGLGPEERLRFQREGEALARVKHPGVVGVHRLGTTAEGDPYLVLDLVEGEDLARRVARAGPLAPAAAARLVRALADAVAALHAAGVAHRDVKPQNVLVGADGAPVLIDLGLARPLDASRLTESGTVLGTPAYMAPEQARGLAVDGRADVHALGLLLLFLLTGRPPYAGAGLAQVVAAIVAGPPRWPEEVPPGLAALGRRATAADPAARPTAAALRDALDAWLAGGEGARRGRAAAVAGAAAVVGLAVVALTLGLGRAGPRAGPGPGPVTSAVAGPPTPTPTPTPTTTALRPPHGPLARVLEYRAARSRGDARRVAALRASFLWRGPPPASFGPDMDDGGTGLAFTAVDAFVLHWREGGLAAVLTPAGRVDVPLASASPGVVLGREYVFPAGDGVLAAPLAEGAPDLAAARRLATVAPLVAGRAVDVLAVAASADGRWLACGGVATGVVLLEVPAPPAAPAPRFVDPLPPYLMVRSLAFDGRRLLAGLTGGGERGGVGIYDLDGAPRRLHLREFTEFEPRAVAPGPGDGFACAAVPSLGLHRVDLRAGALHLVEPLSLEAAATRRLCTALATSRSVAGAWRVHVGMRDGAAVETFVAGPEGLTVLGVTVPGGDAARRRLAGLAASPDGALLGLALRDGSVEVWGLPP